MNYNASTLGIAYDTASRVTSEAFKVSGGSTNWTVSYGYDNVGNRTCGSSQETVLRLTFATGVRLDARDMRCHSMIACQTGCR